MDTNKLFDKLSNIDCLTIVDRFNEANNNLCCSKIIIKTKSNENIIIEPDVNFLRIRYE